MANTFDVELVSDTISETCLTVLTEKLAPLDAFSTDFGVDEMKPGVDVVVGVVEDGTEPQENITNWEQGDTTVGKRKVEVNQISAPFQISPAELNLGHKLQKLTKFHSQKLGNHIMDKVTGIMTAANFGAGIEVNESTFGAADLKAIWGSKENMQEKNIILNGNLYSKFLPENLDSFDPTKSRSGMFGFDGFYHNGRWNGGVAEDVRGFFGDKSAIALASGLPVDEQAPAGEFIIREVIPVNEQLGLSALFTVWFSRSGRKTFASFDMMFGAAKGLAEAGSILVNKVAD